VSTIITVHDLRYECSNHAFVKRVLLSDTDETWIATTDRGFNTRWKKLSVSKEVHLFGRLNIDILNVSLHLVPGGRLHIRMTKSRSSFFMMNKSVESKTVFKFLDAQLLVRHVRTNRAILLAHNSTLSKRSLARYNLRRVELKTFTFSAGSKSLSIYKDVLGPIPKPLLFTVSLVRWTVTPTNFNITISSIFRNL